MTNKIKQDADGTKTRSSQRASRKQARLKEVAEIDRAINTVSQIPSHSQRFILFRKNRRQRARELDNDTSQQQQQRNHPIFNASRFIDLPISTRTLDGLASCAFTTMTSIQRISIPQALAGRDILAAAPTGSGKTLAFLIPILESLWRNKWTLLDGLGALILSPTRELSMQIFDVLRKIAKLHALSAGLVIGGKDFDSERDKIGHMNILVGTPGRVLHHMDHVVDFNCQNLKLFVLDEADRILDMGFKSTLDAIMKNLPQQRQTLLFSATQTKDIKALARLSLKTPEYLSVMSKSNTTDTTNQNEMNNENQVEREDDEDIDHHTDEQNGKDANNEINSNPSSTTIPGVKIVGVPTGLSQSYAVINLEDKLSVLWSFIKTHLKSKMIIFLSSGKQVRFVFETFCKLRPGMSLLHIHGNMKQHRRIEMYEAFCRTKSAALFATDIASRGLDFPNVEWVVQVDCPDDVATYIHRVGRTARFKKNGRAMLFLSQGKEEHFINRLQEKSLMLNKTKINPGRFSNVSPKINALVTNSQDLHVLAQRAFVFYLKAVQQKSDKDVFDVHDIDITALAKSFGLSVTPKVSFKQRGNNVKSSDEEAAKLKTKTVFGYDAKYSGNVNDDDVDDDDDEEERKHDDDNDTRSSTKKRVRNAVTSRDDDDDDDDDDDVLTLKRSLRPPSDDEDNSIEAAPPQHQVQRKRKKRKLDLLKGMPSVHRVVFDDDGNAVRAPDVDVINENDAEAQEEQHDGIEDYAESVKKRLKESEHDDKMRERDRVKTKHAKRRARTKAMQRVVGGAQNEDEEPRMVVSGDEDDEEEEYEDSDDDSDDVDEQEKRALEILHSRSAV